MSAPGLLTALGFSVATGGNPLPPATAPGAFDAPPVMDWQRPLPGPRVPAAIHTELGAPVLSQGLIFVGSAADDALLVLDRRDGSLVRRLPARGPVQSGAVVAGDRVIFSDAAGTTSCYRVANGRLLWQHEGSGPVLASPLLSGGRVVVSDLDNVVTALDADSGEFLWRHSQRVERPSGSPELYGSPTPTPSIEAGQDVLLTGYADGTLVALSADKGEVLWQRRVGEGSYPDLIGATLDLGPSLVAGGFSGPLLALDPVTRAVRWRVDIGSATAPIVSTEGGADGKPTIFHAGVDGKLRCIDVRTGTLLWTWDSLTQGALTRPVLTVAGLLVGSSSGGLYLLDPQTGERRWQLEPGYLLAGLSAPPAVDGRQAVIVTNAGRILSLIVTKPEPAWARGDGDHLRVGGR